MVFSTKFTTESENFVEFGLKKKKKSDFTFKHMQKIRGRNTKNVKKKGIPRNLRKNPGTVGKNIGISGKPYLNTSCEVNVEVEEVKDTGDGERGLRFWSRRRGGLDSPLGLTLK